MTYPPHFLENTALRSLWMSSSASHVQWHDEFVDIWARNKSRTVLFLKEV